MLVVLKRELYEGSWGEMEADLRARRDGKPYIFTYEGREIQFCCSHCKKDFLKDPKTYLDKLDAAAAKQKADAAK